MFLALKEMKKEKSRFAMIILVTALIAYLVYFLSSLAFGLAQINKTAIDYWPAEGIILSEASNKNIYASSINAKVVNELDFNLEDTINVASTTAYITEQKQENPFNIVFMGSDDLERITPPLIEGRLIENYDEIVVSNSLKAKQNFNLNETFVLASTNREFKIVGIVEDANFNTVPVAYVSREMASQESLMFSANSEGVDANTQASPNTPQRVSAILTQDDTHHALLEQSELRFDSIDNFIDGLPGYQAQVLTFGLMIGSLSLISAIIIGIFMYILTMQKKSIFAVLKIQGYQNAYIISAVILQTLILTLLGFIIAFGLAYLTIVLIPDSVPVAISTNLFIGVSLFAIISSLLGSLFSARSVLKIDPLEAL